MNLISTETILPFLTSLICIIFTVSVKYNANKKIEKVKSTLANAATLLEKRRDIYEKIANSLRIFISGHQSNTQIKNNFNTVYSMAWLWAPDSVLISLNKLVDALIITNEQQTIDQELVKKLYRDIIFEMRRDVGFSATKENHYRFTSF